MDESGASRIIRGKMRIEWERVGWGGRERETDSCLLFAQYNETRRPLNIYRKPPSSTPIVNSWLATRTKSGRRIKKEKGINDNKNDWDFSSIDKKEDGHIVTDPTPCLNKSALSVADVARVLNPGLSLILNRKMGEEEEKKTPPKWI